MHFFLSRATGFVGATLLLLCLSSTTILAQTSTLCNTVDCIVDRVKNASPGDEIIVASGTYTISDKQPSTFSFVYLFSDRDGTSSQRITLRGENPNNPPTIQAPANNTGYLLSLEGDYWDVRNINFRTAAKGIVLDNANHCRLIGLRVSDVGEEGIHLRDGSSNNLVRNCNISDTGRQKPGFGEGLYIGSDRKQHYERRFEVSNPSNAKYRRACDNNIMEDCTVGPNITAEGVDVKEGTNYNIIRNCNFIALGVTGANSGDAFIDAKGAETFIYSNTFDARNEPNMLAGVDFQDRGTDFNTGTKIVIHNNQFLTNGASSNVAVARKKGGSPTQVHVWDNIGITAGNSFPSDGTTNFVTLSCPTASWNNVVSCSGTPPPPPNNDDEEEEEPVLCSGNGTSTENVRIEAEDFCDMNGIRTQNTADAGGGMNVGYIDTGDWLDYRLNPPSSGQYTLSLRVASRFSSGEVQLRSGNQVLSTSAIPNTGNWQNWTTITTTVNLSAGSQTLRLYASGRSWNINWFTLEAGSTPPPNDDNDGGNNGNADACAFGAPVGSPLPSFDRVSYRNVHVLGNGGPALDNFRKFTINYNAPANGLYTLALNTSDGVPGYYVDLRPAATDRFNRAQPDLSLSGSNIPGLDGDYWVAQDGDNLALVDKGGNYTIYFSTSATPPDCGDYLAAPGNNQFTGNSALPLHQPIMFPNPATTDIQVSGLYEEHGQYSIIDLNGRLINTVKFTPATSLSIPLTGLPKGSYFLRIAQPTDTWTRSFIRR